jgi:hypothetical protein
MFRQRYLVGQAPANNTASIALTANERNGNRTILN